MNLITSRDNPLVKTLRRLAHESNAYRKLGQFWLEGDHLCRAALQRGARPDRVVLAQSLADGAEADEWLGLDVPATVMPDELFAGLSGLESPARMGFVMAHAAPQDVESDTPTVILDRLQDAGNVGAILRCASAFGFRQVLALQGTAALWSHKVLRAGMGAHFGLHLVEGLQECDLEALALPLVTTVRTKARFCTSCCSRRACPLAVHGSWATRGRACAPALWLGPHCRCALPSRAEKNR